ncbi:MAG: UDP-N-acetylglucosamine 1-carboxyvinyltransferase [Planctomycetota bacterium]|nr:UDP-N-acetylglucosamine 1-carboxyvinyltransferase [Planctomycetota bacterium]
MDTFVIEGGRRLSGRVRINGSKNAALPLLAAALLTDQPVRLRDVPNLADIKNMIRLLGELGCRRSDEPSDGTFGDGTVTVQSLDESMSHARYDIVRTMRASICTLGPMLARRGFAQISLPGGCAIGERPVDLHLRGLAALGAQITVNGGDIIAKVPTGGLVGNTVFLGGPFGSMLLNKMGAKISGHGSPRIVIEGVSELGGADHRVIPDRIEAGTYMMAAAVTNGDIVLENCPVDSLLAAMHCLDTIGVHVEACNAVTTNNPQKSAHRGCEDAMRCCVRVTSDRILHPVEVTTQPHPGFPTDLQAQLMTVLSLADGNSVVTEKIFPDRFLHVAELSRMGAKLIRHGPTVVISGVRRLVGAPVMASDLRASAGLVLAGLAAEGRTIINRVYHLDRGYDRMEDKLKALGAVIQRVDEKDVCEVPVAG